MSLTAVADEGMWMLPYLQKMNIKNMKARGCKLSAEEIYSIDRLRSRMPSSSSATAARARSSRPRGCSSRTTTAATGRSSSSRPSSTTTSRTASGPCRTPRSLPVPGLEVRFIRKISDVTPEIVGNVPSIAGQEEYRKITSGNIEALTEKLRSENPGMEVSVESFFGGNQYFAFVKEVYTDVRLVGAPPSSIGNFGGDTDNWMWPRHTGDFSVFRVYAGPDNRPAAYAAENRPYRAEKFLKVSLDGVEEEDFAMVMGFPGSTERYMTSYEIDNMLGVENPQRIFIRGERQRILWDDMMADPEVRIQYAAKYRTSSNYWKNSIGMSRGIEKLDVKARKEAQEASFQAWAEKNTLPEEGYIDALPKIKLAVERMSAPDAGRQYLSEAFLRGIEPADAGAFVRRCGDDGAQVRDQESRRGQGGDERMVQGLPAPRPTARWPSG